MHSFILGEMYTSEEQRYDLNPMYVKIPEYIFQTSKWINHKQSDFTVAPLPAEKANVYYWGYRGITDVLVKLSDRDC